MTGRDVENLLCHSRGLLSQLMHQGFVSIPQGEGADNVSIHEVCQLVALSRKVQDVVPQGLVRFLTTIVKVLRVS